MQTSERIRPGFVLFEGNITIFAEHIGVITKCNTLANLISFVGRIGDAFYLPEVTELIENLCFGVTHGCFPLTLIEYTILTPLQAPVCHFTNWSDASSSRIVFAHNRRPNHRGKEYHPNHLRDHQRESISAQFDTKSGSTWQYFWSLASWRLETVLIALRPMLAPMMTTIAARMRRMITFR
tara:strand:+ start:451 stop:993 length:543 start_codon:yes stop_codon:yes gene_type:complete